jgi:peroxiredoxin
MKKAIFAILAALPLAVSAQQNYVIKVSVANVNPSAKAYLFYRNKGKLYQDTTKLVNGQFMFKGSVEAPLKAFVLLEHHGNTPIKYVLNPDKIGVYLEKGEIGVNTKDSLVHAVVGGTNLNKEQQQMMVIMEPFRKQTMELKAAYQRAGGDKGLQAKVLADFTSMETKRVATRDAFINGHLNSLVSLNLLRAEVDPKHDAALALKFFSKLTPSMQITEEGKEYKTLIDEANILGLGKIAPDFTLKNTKGEEIGLSSFKGKYVLVDFWASWCGPCRKENPNVVEVYKKYSAKNFTVLGVSLDGGDSGKQKWIDAIAKDGLMWEQVSELKGWESAVAKLYMIKAIPANFLIDPSGKIIGKDLRGEELEKKLLQVL